MNKLTKGIMNKLTKDKDPFTGENMTDVNVKCPVCGRWVMDLTEHAKSQPDPAHSVIIVHSV
jgi:C4-type Zn-finger protein